MGEVTNPIFPTMNVILTTSRAEEAIDDGHTFITHGPNCFGKGKTAQESLANCRKYAPNGYRGYFLTRVCPSDVSVSDIDGALSWDVSHPKDCKICTCGKGIRVTVTDNNGKQV